MNTLNNPDNLEILYEDEDLFIINKPAMLYSVMLKPDEEQNSLAKMLLNANPILAEVGKSVADAGLLQRLDFETSGCILGAKNKEMWQTLFDNLKNGEIKKEYLALIEGQLDKAIHLNTFLGAKGRHSQKVQVIRNSRQERTLPASSDFYPYANHKTKDLALVLAHVPTARRHQIRAHLAYLGYPLLGDELYGSHALFSLEANRKFYLHAFSLNFKHPRTGQNIAIKTTLPTFVTEEFSIS